MEPLPEPHPTHTHRQEGRKPTCWGRSYLPYSPWKVVEEVGGGPKDGLLAWTGRTYHHHTGGWRQDDSLSASVGGPHLPLHLSSVLSACHAFCCCCFLLSLGSFALPLYLSPSPCLPLALPHTHTPSPNPLPLPPHLPFPLPGTGQPTHLCTASLHLTSATPTHTALLHTQPYTHPLLKSMTHTHIVCSLTTSQGRILCLCLTMLPFWTLPSSLLSLWRREVLIPVCVLSHPTYGGGGRRRRILILGFSSLLPFPLPATLPCYSLPCMPACLPFLFCLIYYSYPTYQHSEWDTCLWDQCLYTHCLWTPTQFLLHLLCFLCFRLELL